MSEKGEMRSAINEQDHVIPEVTFPAVETLRDATREGFIYVLGNLLRTRRYGAQESRTGAIKNHLVGIVFSDGELFSNLHFTQALYEDVKDNLKVPIDTLCDRTTSIIPQMLEKEPVRKSKVLTGAELEQLLGEVSAIYQNDDQLKKTLGTLYEQTTTYANTYGANAKKAKK